MSVFWVAEHAVLLAHAALCALGTSGNYQPQLIGNFSTGEVNATRRVAALQPVFRLSFPGVRLVICLTISRVSVQSVVRSVGVHGVSVLMGKLPVTSGVFPVEI